MRDRLTHEDRVIERPRLLNELESSDSRIFVFVAPAGYGKTTLAHQWAASGHGVAWYSCTRASVDISVLGRGLSEAIELGADADLRGFRERLVATPSPQAEADTLADLLRDGIRDWPHDFWLVLDDYHLAADERAAEDFIESLLSDDRVKALVTTRVRPRWASARRLLYGEVSVVDATKLAMTPEEAAAVLRHFDAPLKDDLIALADGWPAVLAYASRTSENPRQASIHALSAFVGEEVLSTLDVVSTAVLHVLACSGTMVRQDIDALLARNITHQLEALSASGLISDWGGGQLSVHPLIREYLRSSHAPRPDKQTRALCRRALRALRGLERWDEAFGLLEQLRDYGQLNALAARAVPLLLKEGRTATVRRWIELGRSTGVPSPTLRLADADLAVRDGLYRRSSLLASEVLDEAEISPDAAYWASMIAGRANHLAGAEHVAVEHFREARRLAADEEGQRSAMWAELASASDLELDDAGELLGELRQTRRSTPVEEVMLAGRQLNLNVQFGARLDFQEAELALQVLADVTDPLVITSFLNSYAYNAAVAGEYERAETLIDMLHDTAQRYRLAFVVPYALLCRALVFNGRRDFEHTTEALAEATAEARRLADVHILAACAAVRSRSLIAQGRFDEAVSVATGPWNPTLPSIQGELLIAQALAYACSGMPDRAIEFAKEATQRTRSTEVRLMALSVRAILAATDESHDAPAHARAAAQLSRGLNVVDGLITAYRGYPDLARLIAASSEHVGWLCALTERSADLHVLQLAGVPRKLSAIETLSKREAEVYALMRRGLSNKEIAEELFITEGTVKSHVHHVYDKLGVRTRLEAALLALPSARDQAAPATTAGDVVKSESENSKASVMARR